MDPNNPLGGILTRFQFPGVQHLPFLTVPLSMAPTPTGPFTTDIYTAAYDGWANFPRDPGNLLADLNAIIGILTVHNGYPGFDNLADTNFYMIPTEQLPILWPLYQLGDFGKVLGDALAPGLQLGIDWGYGNPGSPGAGIPLDGVDPIGVAGPWQVTAGGQLADDSGIAGFLLRMDPLQMLAGLQYAAVHSFVNPVNDLLGFAGVDPLSGSFVDTLLTGYTVTNALDALLLTGWNDLAGALNLVDLLGPAAIFNGAPLISAEPLIAAVGLIFDLFNFFGA